MKFDVKLAGVLLYCAALLPFLGQHPSAVIFCCLGGMGINLFLVKIGKELPAYIFYGGVLAAVYLIYNLFGGFKGLEPGISFLALLGMLKLFELNEERDFFILCLIVELLFIGHMLTIDSLGLIFYVAAISFLIFLSLSFFHNKKRLEEYSKEKLRIFIQIFLVSIPGALFLFVIFPRLYMGNIFFPNLGKVSRIGFAEKLRPGDFAKIVPDKTTFFRVEFEKGLDPSRSELYWRGAVLGKTDGFSWEKGIFPRTQKQEFADDILSKYRVSYSELKAGYLFLLDGTSKVKVSSAGRLMRDTGDTYKFLPLANQKIKFIGETSSKIPLKLQINNQGQYLELPKNMSKKVKALAKSFKGNTSYDRAQEILSYFSEQPFYYSLEPGRATTGDPLEEFLFKKRKGYCEHYASATAILLRLIKVPSRIVTGFQGGLYNSVGNYYQLRGEDAHAWVEGYFQNKGWVRIDPVQQIAPYRIEFGAQAFFLDRERPNNVSFSDYLKMRQGSLLQKMLHVFDMAYFSLNSSFIGYDWEVQRDLLKKFGLGKVRPITLTLISIGLLFGIHFLIAFFRGRSSARLPLYEKRFRKFCKKLTIAPLLAEGPQVFKDRLLTENPKASVSLEKILDLYILVKYDPSHMASHESELLQCLKNFRSDI
ncbi:MAG: DUF3488 domain-containing protein [Halobacteriovoraceae bacterium]|nr:DUF3488 domain-containing protein [Halobacteriovoraceae bacterium]